MKFNYTPKQRSIMEFIAAYRRIYKVSPSMAEIGRACGNVHRVTVFQHLNSLENRGAITRIPGLSRSIAILDPEFSYHPCPMCGGTGELR